jgi:hypothetical protein
LKKSTVIKTKRARPTLQTIRTKSHTGPRRKNPVHKGKIFSAALPKPNCGVSKSISVHFPEGGVITLKFQLTTAEASPQAYNQEIYHLIDIGLGLEMVKLNPEAILSIVKTLKSVSLGHTS